MQLDAEDVVAVGRERVHDRDAAARAVRRTLDVPHLRCVLGNWNVAALGVALRSPTARRLICARRAQVAFHQRRRERLRVGDVVEAVADGVGRAGTP